MPFADPESWGLILCYILRCDVICLLQPECICRHLCRQCLLCLQNQLYISSRIMAHTSASPSELKISGGLSQAAGGIGSTSQSECDKSSVRCSSNCSKVVAGANITEFRNHKNSVISVRDLPSFTSPSSNTLSLEFQGWNYRTRASSSASHTNGKMEPPIRLDGNRR